MTPNTASIIAKRMHHGQLYGDRPYLEHVTDVAMRVIEDRDAPTDAIVVAWLHDVLEDTHACKIDLQAQGITPRQLRALLHLTRHQGESYDAYIARCIEDPIAALVKLHDLESNLEHEPPEQLVERYKTALVHVRQRVGDISVIA